MSSAVITTDHDEIRDWVESNNGRPACVSGTGGRGDLGLLRIDFDEQDSSLVSVSWDEWFDAFEQNELALLHAEDSRFNKLVSREGRPQS